VSVFSVFCISLAANSLSCNLHSALGQADAAMGTRTVCKLRNDTEPSYGIVLMAHSQRRFRMRALIGFSDTRFDS
jgi:hypothetical protein